MKYLKYLFFILPLLFFENVFAESLNFDTMKDLNLAYAYNYNITNNTTLNQNIINNRSERNVGGYYFTRFSYTLNGANHIRFRYNSNSNLNGKYNIYFTVIANNNDVSNYNAVITRGTIEYPCTFRNTWSHNDSDETGLTVSNNNGVLSYICKNVEIYPTSQIDIRLMNETSNWGTEQSFAISRYITIQGVDDISSSINNQTQQQHQDSQNIQNSITDDDVEGGNSSVDDLFNNDAFNDDSGINAIITIPLNFIQSLTNKTCSSINITLPFFNINFSIPCMSSIYSKVLGTNLLNVVSGVINGIICYRLLLEILFIIRNAKNPKEDRIEVLEL